MRWLTLDRSHILARSTANNHEHRESSFNVDRPFFTPADYADPERLPGGIELPAFNPITPSRAVQILEAAGFSDAPRLIADYTAAGVVKSYALIVDSIAPSGRRDCARGGTIQPDLWQRMIDEDAAHLVWNAGTVRLLGGDDATGRTKVNITGIGFSEKHVHRLVEHLGGSPIATAEVPRTPEALSVPAPDAGPAEKSPPAAVTPIATPRTTKPDPGAIPAGAILATVNQTMAALGIGRTKVNALMNEGRLVRRKVDRSTKIEVASIHALAGQRD